MTDSGLILFTKGSGIEGAPRDLPVCARDCACDGVFRERLSFSLFFKKANFRKLSCALVSFDASIPFFFSVFFFFFKANFRPIFNF